MNIKKIEVVSNDNFKTKTFSLTEFHFLRNDYILSLSLLIFEYLLNLCKNTSREEF